MLSVFWDAACIIIRNKKEPPPVVEHQERQGDKELRDLITLPLYQNWEENTMATDEKKQKKYREAAAKLSRPTPRELPSGAWRCEVMVNGERISIVDEDPSVAHAKALAIKAGVVEKSNARKEDKITFADALDKYIEDRREVWSPSTVRTYTETKKNRLQSLMSKRVLDIDENTLQIVIGEEAKAGLSAKTIKNDISLAVTVLSQYKVINVKRLKFPQRAKQEHAYLDTEQIVTLINACVGDKAEIPILLALWLGMRRSEILGLHWDCVDFENKTIKIERSLVRDETGAYVIKDYLKNEGSRRQISCPEYILNKLKEHPGERKGPVFKERDPSFIYDRLRIICKKEGITFPGVHGLRHTNASVMLSLGIIDKYAMARGGWSTDHTMKTVYQHLFSDKKQTADIAIDSYFESLLRTASRTEK
jgi:integrase